MAPKKIPDDPFQERFLDLLEGTIEGIDKKVDVNAKQIKKNNDRLNRIESVLFPEHIQNIKDLPKWWQDPKLIKIFTILAAALFILVSIYGAAKGIHFPGSF